MTKSISQNPSKERLFTIVALLIPVLFFVLLELGLRVGNYRGNTDLFLPMEWNGETYYRPNPIFSSRYFYRLNNNPTPTNEIFPANKPDTVLRFFAIGGSSAAGYPYGHNALFSRVTRDILDDQAPDKYVEIINVAMSAVNTYTLYDMLDEILEHSPDGILMYAGHNEYYGALGVGSVESLGRSPEFVRIFLKIQRYKTFQLLRDILTWFQTLFSGSVKDSGTLMERVVKEQFITFGSDIFFDGLHQFENNLRAISQRLDEADVPLFVSTIASNLKDHYPFESVTHPSLGRADTTFNSAWVEYDNGRFDKAYTRFLLAKDLDALRFRAPERINRLIEMVAKENENVYLVNTYERLRAKSEHGIPGKELFLEHLHPNAEGNLIIGASFAQDILNSGLYDELQPVSVVDLDRYRNRMYMSEFDHKAAEYRLRHLMRGWPFVKGNVQRPPVTYEGKSLADSIAYEVYQKNMLWTKGKLVLATKYVEKGRIDDAITEFMGLIRDDPYNISPYNFATRLLLDRQDFQRAYPLLSWAHSIEPTPYTYKMLGITEITRGNNKKAIQLLNTAAELSPDDVQIMYNLSGAYGVVNDFEKAFFWLEKVETKVPNFPGLRAWRQELESKSRKKK